MAPRLLLLALVLGLCHARPASAGPGSPRETPALAGKPFAPKLQLALAAEPPATTDTAGTSTVSAAPRGEKARKRALLGIILVLALAIGFVLTREGK